MGLLSFFLRPRLPNARDYLKPLPYIEESVVRLSWEATGNEFNLYVKGPNSKALTFRIDPTEFSKVNSGKLTDDVSKLTFLSFEGFRKALAANPEHERFSEWWKQKASDPGQLFQFDFAKGPWTIPWELLLGLLLFQKTRLETAIVRCIGEARETCDSLTTASLRVMIVRADAPDLNLDEEINRIRKAWNGLEYEIREAVCEPVVIEADQEVIIAKLKEVKPNVIWFSGHGRYDGTVRLIFSKQKEVTAEEFAEMFSKAKHCPEFAVFWACETAMGTAKVHSRPPDLFAALHRQGVAAMIGMQSAVADFAAIVMAGQLFRGLSQGLPLEWAVARARSWFHSIDDEEQPTMDWATPVVWSAERPVTHLDWAQVRRFRLQMQLLGTISIAEGQQGAGLDEEPPDSEASSRAQDWLTFGATIVRGSPDSPEHRLWFLRTLKGIQTISNRTALLIDPGDAQNSKHAFQQWAERFLGVLDLQKGRLPGEFLTRIDILKKDAQIGWRRICLMQNCFLAIIGPPPAEEEWFWIPLFNRTDPFAVLTDKEIPERFKEFQANYLVVGRNLDETQLDDAKNNHPRLLLALSVINIPIRVETLKKLEFGENAEILFRKCPNLFMGSFGGYIICAEVRNMILSEANPDALDQARRDCIALTEVMGYRRKPYLMKLRIDLLTQLEEHDRAVQDLSDLLELYRKDGQQVPIIRAMSEFFKLREGLTAWEWLNVAAVYLQLGDQINAKIWLRCEPDEPLDIAYKFHLEAEFAKNSGDIDGARDLIEKAIRIYDEIQKNDSYDPDYKDKARKDLLERRHDRARLLQFQEEKFEAAANEYQGIIDTIEKEPSYRNFLSVQQLLAVTHRNLGECILSLKDKETEDRWREAESHFQSALTYEQKIRLYSNLIAETCYQLARLAKQKGQLAEERNQLEKCIDYAEESRHGMMAAIAKNRLFWLDLSEQSKTWNDVAEQWELLSDFLRVHGRHSWSLRTLINANVRVAKKLLDENRPGDAKKYLQDNLSLLRNNSNLRRKGDLERVILTLAGLHIISSAEKDGVDYWSLLESEFGAAKSHALSIGASNPNEAWKRSI
jgi:tetratricopeptide (TPR) repeat protein